MSPEDGVGVTALILLNIFCSVSIVTVNKLLVEHFGFKFVLLLTSLHFFTGWLFLRFASSEGCRLFVRAQAPWRPIVQLSIAGAGSIALLNYSLRLNSVGTYQIMKVAILPVTMALSAFEGIASPSRSEVGAAALVIAGTLVCTASDVWVTLLGVAIGVLGVVSTAQYQIWQFSVQKDHGLNSTQALYLMSPPQAALALLASVLLETNWPRVAGRAAAALWGAAPAVSEAAGEDGVASVAAGAWGAAGDDIWHHPYTAAEVAALLATCVFAVGLNYSTIAVIGRTSAVTMQFVNQLKTVLTIAMGLVLFPKPMPPSSLLALAAGLCLVFCGVAWYTKLKSAAGAAPKAAGGGAAAGPPGGAAAAK